MSLGSLTLDLVAQTGRFNSKIEESRKKVTKFRKSFKGIPEEAKASSKGLSMFGNALTRTISTVTKLGLALGGAAAAGFTAFTVSSIRAAAAMETTKASFETMLGSASKADELVGDLFDFSKVTPFTPDDVFKSAKALLAGGIDEEKIVSEVALLGDVAAGTGSKLSELALIFSEVSAKGKADATDLRQFGVRGINVLKGLGETTGKTTAEVRKMVSEGLIGLPELEAAFRTMTTEGGLFFGGMERQSKTLSGIMSTLRGNFEAGQVAFGKAVADGIRLKDAMSGLSKSVSEFKWKEFGELAAGAFREMAKWMKPAVALAHAMAKAYEFTLLATYKTVESNASIAASLGVPGAVESQVGAIGAQVELGIAMGKVDSIMTSADDMLENLINPPAGVAPRISQGPAAPGGPSLLPSFREASAFNARGTDPTPIRRITATQFDALVTRTEPLVESLQTVATRLISNTENELGRNRQGGRDQVSRSIDNMIGVMRAKLEEVRRAIEKQGQPQIAPPI